jgi:uncharacterized protein YijF (DUF1287 family)
VARAREEVARGVAYDPSYVALTFASGVDTGHPVYPNGDLDPSRGVCTDVVVRALRAAGVDLQSRVHEDIRARPAAYAAFVSRADANIDHRRAGPLMVWLEAHAKRLPRALDPDGRATFEAGDVVVWSLRGGGHADHVGIVSDRRGTSGLPLVVHNIGPQPAEEDVLASWVLLGHYRVVR